MLNSLIEEFDTDWVFWVHNDDNIIIRIHCEFIENDSSSEQDIINQIISRICASNNFLNRNNLMSAYHEGDQDHPYYDITIQNTNRINNQDLRSLSDYLNNDLNIFGNLNLEEKLEENNNALIPSHIIPTTSPLNISGSLNLEEKLEKNNNVLIPSHITPTTSSLNISGSLNLEEKLGKNNNVLIPSHITPNTSPLNISGSLNLEENLEENNNVLTPSPITPTTSPR